MPTLYILFFNDDLFTPRLELIRRICEPSSHSKPHITVRGPVKRHHVDTNLAWGELPEIQILGPDVFFGNLKGGQLQNTVFLKCDFKDLFSIYYKPDYSSSVPHITLYDGKSREFAVDLFQCISKYSWTIKFQVTEYPKLTEITLTRNSPKIQEKNRGYSPLISRLFNDITNKKMDFNYLTSISNQERLYLVEKIIDDLEINLKKQNKTLNSDTDNKKSEALHLQLEKNTSEYSDPQKKRERLGQYKTPPEVAKEIVRSIEFLLPKLEESIDFGDPAIGSGTFYSALEEIVGLKYIRSAIGVEIDRETADLTQEYLPEDKIKIINKDFFKVGTLEKRNLIISNPPYVRYQLIDSEKKIQLKERVNSELGINVSGQSSLFLYFILLAHSWMRENAISVWLIPSDFLVSKYGAALREYLTKKVTLIRIHQFRPHEIQFEGVDVTSVIVVFRNQKPNLSDIAKFSIGGRFGQPQEELSVTNQVLITKDRWRWVNLVQSEKGSSSLKLGNLFDIKRGIATGANSFFILQREKAISLGIPENCLRPILPNPQELRRMGAKNIIESDKDGYPLLFPQRSVINCDLDEAAIKKEYPLFWEYLCSANDKGIRDRYLIRSRKVWYKQEERETPVFLCTYMGRNKANQGPFRFILNKSNAIATNQYLFLYPKGKFKKLIETKPKLILDIYKLLNKINQESLMNGGRVYSGGLYKIEPGELKKINAEIFTKIIEDYDKKPD